MTAELTKLRTKFVERVSTEILNQLFDYLEDDRIFNSGEVQAIKEDNPRTSDRARKLIDNVKRKGEWASNKLIHHLRNRDPTLYEYLCQECGLTADPPAQQALQRFTGEQGSLVEHDGPSTLVKITKSFCSEREIYPVSSISIMNRVALLINNMNFEQMPTRRGAEIDEENMEKLLPTLGYEVVKHRNLTAMQMVEALDEFSKHPKLTKTDSVFVVIMSQGIRDAVFGIDEDTLKIDNIYNHLDAQNCPALIDKPKIIIIQACRGQHSGTAIRQNKVEANKFTGGGLLQTHSPPTKSVSSCKVSLHLQSSASPSNFAQSDNEDGAYTHKEKDFIALLSSTPDTLSYRNPSKGSFMIKFTVSVFEQFHREDDIEELFRKVMREFEKTEELPNRLKQMPTKDRCTLTRLFYFFPGV